MVGGLLRGETGVACKGKEHPVNRINKRIMDIFGFTIRPFPGMKNAPKALYNLIVPRRYV
jgi:hypothetical protein